MFEGPFQDLLIVLGSATLILVLFNALKIPTLVGFIGVGVVIGPHGLSLISSLPGAQVISDLGIMFLLFTIGLEFSFQKLSKYKKPLIFIGAVQVVLTVGIVYLGFQILTDLSHKESLLWGFMISLSCTAICLKLLHQKRELETAHGNSSLNILIAQDILTIPMLMMLPSLLSESSTSPMGFVSIAEWSLKAIIVTAVVALMALKIMPYLFEKVVKTKSRELFFFFMVFVCFGVAYLFHLLTLPVALGAFAAGLIVSESPYGKQATSDFIPLRDNFLALFFISIGMLLDIHFLAENVLNILALGISVFFLKIIIVYLTLRLNQLTHKTSLITSLLLFQVGEFSFVLANESFKLGILDSLQLQYFLSISIVSLALTPFIFSNLNSISEFFLLKKIESIKFPKILPKNEFEKEAAKSFLKDHVVIIGFGVAGQKLAQTYKDLNIPYVVIEFNPESYKKLHLKGETIVFGDASSISVLEKADTDKAKLIIITASATAEHLQAILDSCMKLNREAKIIVRIQYERQKEQISLHSQMRVIVAEHETAIEVLRQSLHDLDVSIEEIQRNVIEVKKSFDGMV